MNKPNPDAIRSQNARLLLKELQGQFPVFRDSLPLMIGIDKELLARLPDIDRRDLRIALGIHTHSLRYLKAISKGTQRHNLDGHGEEEITATHRNHASELLRERLARQAEQRKAQREAEVLARQRAQKLDQLVEKFGRQR